MRPVLIQPDPRLRQIAQPVALFDEKLRLLADELDAVMRAGPGGVGIAAPQIGETIRLVIVDCSLAQRPCRNHGRLVMANPEIVGCDGEALGREGCLSVPDWVGVVPRAKKVDVRYADLTGEEQALHASGFEARVIQHELDHLDGVLFTDRVVSTHDLVRRMQQE